MASEHFSGEHISAAPADASLPEEYRRKFTKEEINDLPQVHYEGELILVREEAELEPALERLGADPVLGFDTETRPSFSKGKSYPPALIQLAGPDVVVIVQLKHVPFNGALSALLTNAHYIKAGVAVHDDIKALQRVLPFSPAGFVDLSLCARAAGLETFGLRPLAANLLGVRISKSAQCSNWANDSLSVQQIRYAATDAWISREIYLSMRRLGLNVTPH